MQIAMIEVGCFITIKRDGICFLDSVKTQLLREIALCGSLSGAAKEMKISYQHAWAMINEMNRAAPEALVLKQRGGSNGGGAVITSYGERILGEYKLIEAQMNRFVSQINTEINL